MILFNTAILSKFRLFISRKKDKNFIFCWYRFLSNWVNKRYIYFRIEAVLKNYLFWRLSVDGLPNWNTTQLKYFYLELWIWTQKNYEIVEKKDCQTFSIILNKGRWNKLSLLKIGYILYIISLFTIISSQICINYHIICQTYLFIIVSYDIFCLLSNYLWVSILSHNFGIEINHLFIYRIAFLCTCFGIKFNTIY
jgi:hypothetical protein